MGIFPTKVLQKPKFEMVICHRSVLRCLKHFFIEWRLNWCKENEKVSGKVNSIAQNW